MDAEVDNRGEEEEEEEEEEEAKLDGGGRERKRRRTDARPPASRWRSPAEQRSYSSKLFEALRYARRAPAAAQPPRGRAVREAADRVLAIAARGRTRWSRAILSRCRALKLRRRRRAVLPRPGKAKGASTPSTAKAPALERKVRVLGRLVPGCGKLSFPSLLDETSDYIAALEMQVRAMTALTEILSSLGAGGPPQDRLGSSSSSATTSSSSPQPDS